MTTRKITRPAQIIFFIEQAMKAPEAFRLHIAWGVWDPIAGLGPDNEESDRWNNVTEHCLIAMTRGEVLAEMLQFPTSLKKKLMTALALHDISKPEEVIHAENAGGRTTWEGYEEVVRNVDAKLKKIGFDEVTIHLSGAMGHPSLLETEALLKKTKYSPLDLAYLVAHYCDDISVKAGWCAPVEVVNDKKINQLDRRIERNVNNHKITQLGEDGKSRLNGRNTFDAQHEIGHAVESVLAAELKKKRVPLGESLDLPELIDNEIKAKIESIQANLGTVSK